MTPGTNEEGTDGNRSEDPALTSILPACFQCGAKFIPIIAVEYSHFNEYVWPIVIPKEARETRGAYNEITID